MLRRSNYWIMLLALSALAPTARASVPPPSSPRAIPDAIVSATGATVYYTAFTEAPAGFETRLPCRRLRTVALGPRKMDRAWFAEFRTVLGGERDWIAPDSIEDVRWLPVGYEPSTIIIVLQTPEGVLTTRWLPNEQLVVVLGDEGIRGAFDCSGRTASMIALLREAFAKNLAGIGPLPGGPSTGLLPTTHGMPPFGSIVICDRLPEAIERVPPTYPDAAREKGVDGVVQIGALVDSTGSVIETRIERSVPMLDQVAVAAVERWRFRPAEWHGSPIPAWTQVPVKFNLH